MVHYQYILALIPYTFHWFGLFMALAFTGTYFAFRSEYKRKEGLGQISAFHAEILDYGARQIFLGFLIGFLLGFKGAYFLETEGFSSGSLLSSAGSRFWGIVGAILVCAGTILYQKLGRKKSEKAFVQVHPVQLMDSILLYCGVFGFLGAMLFAKLDDTAGFGDHPLQWLLSYNGLSYYGALIFGALTFLYINVRHGINWKNALDIGSPGMMLAYAIGRMGCHVSGDGDWGIPHLAARPDWLRWLPDWAWAYRYPHNVAQAGSYIPGCIGNYCTQLILPVYPTSLYESIICFLLFALLWFMRRRIFTPGILFCWFAILNGTERFLMEFIKINPRYTLFGLSLSQAQWIALGWILAGAAGLIAWMHPSRPSSSGAASS